MEFQIKLDSVDKVKKFNQLAEKVVGDVDVMSGRYVIDGKSIMGLFSLDLSKELTVKFVVDANNIHTTKELVEFMTSKN